MLKTYACFTNSCKREQKNDSAAYQEVTIETMSQIYN